MTDLEKIELAMHRVAEQASGSPFGYWLKTLANQIAEDEHERGNRFEPKVQLPCTCHPNDNPPRPCPQKFAYSECVQAALTATER